MAHQRPWVKLHEELGIKPADPIDWPLGTYLEDNARKIPDAPALHYFAKTFNYADYNKEANKLANALSAMGVGKGDVVGCYLPNIPQYPIALAAISKIGAIGSGVSPLLAPPELTHQIRDAGIKVLITLSDLAPAVTGMTDVPDCLHTLVTCGAGDYLGAPDIGPTALDGKKSVSYQQLIDGADDRFVQVDTHWNDTFMIQYTGGTTGKPKGAELSIRTLMHNPVMAATGDNPMAYGEERFFSAFPLFHAAGLALSLTAAVYGGSSELLPNPRDIDRICARMKENPPTRLAAVPALYDMMLAHPLFKDIDFSDLKYVRMGAAPMTSTTYQGLKDIVGEGKITDVFGMTETGPCYVTHPATRYKPGSIGIPIAGTDVRIMDSETGTKDMPLGEPGEICTAGPQVMKGYLGLPEESARALREIDGHIWMYSGDVGYMDEEGYIFLCDRAKDMLIVGGFKVFSVEVEDKLCTLPEIASCAIIGTADEKRPGNDIVNLYIQLEPDYTGRDEAAIKETITAFCRANMAPYKVPKQIYVIDEIPLTPVGKIDKKALRRA